MGLVHTEITLKNGIDMIMAKKGLMPDHEIRQTAVNALVDSGAWTMVINDATREKLGLEATRTATGTLPMGHRRNINLHVRLKFHGKIAVSFVRLWSYPMPTKTCWVLSRLKQWI